jgi:probable biosynthetic protein (TIGR04098 family)
MKQYYLQIMQQAVPAITEKDLDIPLRDAGIDSLDLVVIRVALEKHFGFEVSDIAWFGFNTLSEALNYFVTNSAVTESKKPAIKNVSVSKQVEITMPQMANSALSENWLLKELGDLHWRLLSDGIEQKSSEFKDEMGNRLYATFIRICYLLSNLKSFQENEKIDFAGRIKRFGNSTYLSHINGENENHFIKANLMTTFSVRSADDNSKIEKSNPVENINHIEEINSIPNFLSDYRLLRKTLVDTWQLSEFTFPVSKETIFESDYKINPYYEINGVGLLYFAVYPIISDFCTTDFYKNKFDNHDWFKNFQTTHRDINYFANCNAEDKIVFQLNNFEQKESSIKTVTTLYRQSDKTMLAKIFTIKQRSS